MEIDKTELRKGIKETQQYLLSHHERDEWYRCYALVVFNRRIHICARCLGIYPGIIAGILTHLLWFNEFINHLLIALLPLPALADWSLTSFTKYQGYNVIRTTTGALLGCGYGLGIGVLLIGPNTVVFSIGLIYAFASVILLKLKYSACS